MQNSNNNKTAKGCDNETLSNLFSSDDDLGDMSTATKEQTTATTTATMAVAPQIRFSRYTSKVPDFLSKRYSLVDGKLHKEGGGQMAKGKVEIMAVANLQEFAGVRDVLSTAQCFGFGVPTNGNADVVTRTALEGLEAQGKAGATVARLAKHFQWLEGPGIAAIDHDGLADGTYLSQAGFIDVLYEVMPELRQAEILWAPSSSSFISNSETGEVLQGLRGQRAYIAVDRASQIPRIVRLISERLWLAGKGWHDVTVNGGRRESTAVDLMMTQPERLDFAAGAVMTGALTQKKSQNKFFGSGLLNTASVPDLSPEEVAHVGATKAISYASKYEKAMAIKVAYDDEKADEIVAKTGVSKPEAQRVVQRATERGELSGEFVLTLADGETVTVAEVLRDPKKYHGTYLCDPIEPKEGDKAWLGLLNGPPILHSHKHGGKTYKLVAQRYSLDFRSARFAEGVREVCEILRDSVEWFTLGSGGRGLGGVRSLVNGELQEYGRDGFEQRLDELIRFRAYNDKTKNFIDGPINPRLAARVAETVSTYLPIVKTVVDRPLLLPNGRILQRNGYDAETNLLFSLRGEWPAVPEQPSDDEALKALHSLWAPFEEFRFKAAGDRGGHLAAILSAVVRAGLPTCPMFLYAAHAIGSGKSLLAQCVGALVGGATPNLELDRSHRERQQQIRTMLKDNRNFLLFDNVQADNRIGGQTLELTLTSEFIDGRQLGGNTSLGNLPNKALFVMTGNNPSLTTDMGRRTVWVWLEPPTGVGRHFAIDPLAHVRENRREMATAAITLMKWALNLPTTARQLDSFDQWSRLVSFAVEQIGLLEAKTKTLSRPRFINPIADVTAYMEHGETTADLKALLVTWHLNSMEDGITARELLLKYRRAEDGNTEPLGVALMEYLPEAPRTAKALGYALRGVVGCPVEGFTLVTARDSKTNSCVWKVTCG